MSESEGEVFAEELYARHKGALMRLAWRLTGQDWQRAEDLAQEAIVRAWEHRHTIRPGGERAWLAVTARRLAVDGHRRLLARQARETQYADFTAVQADDPAGRVADAATVSAAMAALSPRRRAVIAQLYYMGRSTGETAAVLGIAPGTVKSRAHYGLAAMRAALETGTRPAVTGRGERGQA